MVLLLIPSGITIAPWARRAVFSLVTRSPGLQGCPEWRFTPVLTGGIRMDR
jgi:hypothetical protein